MKRFRTGFLMIAALAIALAPMAVMADEPPVEVRTEGEPGEVPTPIICVVHHPVGVCIPPW